MRINTGGPLGFAGTAVSLIGLLAIAGWLTGSDVLVRLAPGLPSIKFQTAICLTLLGPAATLAVTPQLQPVRLRRLSMLLAGMAMVVAAPALWPATIHRLTFSPGTETFLMTTPPLPAAGVLLAAVATGLIAGVPPDHKVWPRRLACALGLLAGWIGFNGLIELPLRAFAGLTTNHAGDMGLLTGVALLLLGPVLGFAALADLPAARKPGTRAGPPRSPRRWRLRDQRDWLPLAAFLLVLTVPFYLAQLLAEQQNLPWPRPHLPPLPAMVFATGALTAALVAGTIQLTLTALWHARQARQSSVAALRAREALRASHQRFEAVAQATTDAVWDWDLLHDTVWWNEGYTALSGHATGDGHLGAAAWLNQIHPEDRGAVQASMTAALASEHDHWSATYRFAHRDGHWIDVADRGLIIRRAGQAVRMVGGMTDITRSNETQRILRDRERFFELSLELLAIARPDGMVIQVNPAFERLLGWPPAEVVGRPFGRLVHVDDRAVARAVFARLTAGTEIRAFALRMRARDGQWRWFEWSAARAAEGLLYGAGHEVTERKLAETRLRRMIARLEAGNRELQELGQVAAHDLQEPVRRVRHALSELAARAARDVTLQDPCRRAEQGVTRLQTLLGELLAYARVGSEGSPFLPVELDGVVDRVLTDLDGLIARLGCRVERRPLPRINADAAQMHQLFHNLLCHALRVHRPGIQPRLRIDAQAIPVETAGETEMVSVVIEAMPLHTTQAHHERRAVPLHTGPERGNRQSSGISLAIARRIVARHHGALLIHSAPHTGARFEMRLPRALALARL